MPQKLQVLLLPILEAIKHIYKMRTIPTQFKLVIHINLRLRILFHNDKEVSLPCPISHLVSLDSAFKM
jgi:hypothetical protein